MDDADTSGAYREHTDKAVAPDARFRYVMALALDPRDASTGVIRCITSREGDVQISGYIDRSELHRITRVGAERYEIGEPLRLAGMDDVLAQINPHGYEFIGPEDPDLHVDSSGNVHLYFTLPLLNRALGQTHIYLGHAVGRDLDSLKATLPVLSPDAAGNGAKELSIVPARADGSRLNLIESSMPGRDFAYSTVRIAHARNMNDLQTPWTYGDTVFHPLEANIPWIAGHASPGPVMPRSFLDVGAGKIAGFMNGREANRLLGSDIVYGMFSVGLFVYDYEQGVIDWVSPEPFIRDTEAKTITFASQFTVDAIDPTQGTLYAHVDDAFVRAYSIDADAIRSCLFR